MISEKTTVNQCLQQWNISPEKVFLIITDNGSNMVRAVKSLNERLEEIEEEEEKMQQIQRSEVAEAVNEHEEAGEEIHMRLYIRKQDS